MLVVRIGLERRWQHTYQVGEDEEEGFIAGNCRDVYQGYEYGREDDDQNSIYDPGGSWVAIQKIALDVPTRDKKL